MRNSSCSRWNARAVSIGFRFSRWIFSMTASSNFSRSRLTFRTIAGTTRRPSISRPRAAARPRSIDIPPRCPSAFLSLSSRPRAAAKSRIRGWSARDRCSAASSKFRRGWLGFGVIFSTSIWKYRLRYALLSAGLWGCGCDCGFGCGRGCCCGRDCGSWRECRRRLPMLGCERWRAAATTALAPEPELCAIGAFCTTGSSGTPLPLCGINDSSPFPSMVKC